MAVTNGVRVADIVMYTDVTLSMALTAKLSGRQKALTCPSGKSAMANIKFLRGRWFMSVLLQIFL